MKFTFHGEKDRTALPLVLVHGFGSDGGSWALNVPVLATHRNIFVIDLPGHGQSPGPVSPDAAAATPEALLDWAASVGLDRFHLVGLSMGAAIAQSAALSAPERVASLTLLSSVALGELSQAFVDGFLAATDARAMQPLIEMLFADPAYASPDLIDDLVRYKRTPGTDADLHAYAGTILADTALVELRDRFGELAMPTLVIFGADDRVTLPPSPLPRGFIMVPDVGHMPHIEAAATVNDALTVFLAENA